MDEASKSNHFLQYADKLAYFFITLFALECAFGSSGRWLAVGPVSIRILLFFMSFICTLPLLWQARQELLKQPFIIMLVVFVLWLGVTAFLGYRFGNPLHFIVNDVSSFLTLALLPGAILTLRTGERLRKVTKLVFYGSAVLALITIIIHYTLPLNWYTEYGLYKIIDGASLGGLARIGYGVHRIYFRSQIFMQITILIGLWLMQAQTQKKLLHTILTGFIVFSFILSFTRGFWIGFLLALLLLVITSYQHWRLYLKSLMSVACVVLLLSAISWGIYDGPSIFLATAQRFNPRLVYLFPDDGKYPTASEDPQKGEEVEIKALGLRIKSLLEHQRLVYERPIFGWGLGKNLDGIRTDGKTEYLYWDITMKMGIIGLLLFGLVCLYEPLRFAVKMLTCKTKRFRFAPLDSVTHLAYIYVAGFISVGLTSYVNPFLSSPLGISILMLTITSCIVALQENGLN